MGLGQLAFEIGHARFEFRGAAFQPFAVRAFVFLLGLRHDGKTLINRRKTTKLSSKPVNGYQLFNWTYTLFRVQPPRYACRSAAAREG